MEEREAIQFPALQTAAGEASRKKQNEFFNWKRVEYFLIIIAALFTVMPSGYVDYKWSGLIGGSALFVAAVVLVFERMLGPRDHWFDCRALAEAVKAEAWRFMTAVGDYRQDKDDPEAKESFRSYLRRVNDSLRTDRMIAPFMKDLPEEEITSDMIANRKNGLEERKSLYRRLRIVDQKRWYAAKSNQAHSMFNRYLIGLIALLLVGFVLGLIQFYGDLYGFAPVGFLSALTASAAGWMQIKRYEMLASTYARAARELSILADTVQDVANQEGLEKLVRNGEEIISKEHSVWIDRN